MVVKIIVTYAFQGVGPTYTTLAKEIKRKTSINDEPQNLFNLREEGQCHPVKAVSVSTDMMIPHILLFKNASLYKM